MKSVAFERSIMLETLKAFRGAVSLNCEAPLQLLSRQIEQNVLTL